MRLRLTPRANADLEGILAYLNLCSPATAGNVMTRLRAAILRIAARPLAGVETDMADVRVRFIGRYPYKVFYRIQDRAVEILHIRHTSRRPFQAK